MKIIRSAVFSRSVQVLLLFAGIALQSPPALAVTLIEQAEAGLILLVLVTIGFFQRGLV